MRTTTEPPEIPTRRLRRMRTLRRVGLVVLAGVVAAGATGWLGVRSATVSAAEGPTTLTVRYARIARPGLTAPLVIEVRREGGFVGEQVVVEIPGSYLAAFDWNVSFPEPSDQTREGDTLVWTFVAPPGEVLRITLDVRLNPSVQLGVDGSVGVREEGDRVARVSFRTEVMP